MFCPSCGANLPEGRRFCAVCGFSLNQAETGAGGRQVADNSPKDERLAQFQREQAEALRAERERVLESYETPRNVETTPVAQVLGDGRLVYKTLSNVSGEVPTRDAATELKEAKAAYKRARKAAGKSAAPKVIAVIAAIAVAFGLGAGTMWFFMGQQSSTTPTQSSASSATLDSSASKETSSENASSDAASLSSASVASSSSSTSTSASSSSSAPSANTTTASSSSSSSATSSASSKSSSASAQGGIDSYAGTWKGNMIEPTHYMFVKTCYGAEDYPIALNIKKVSATGKVTADVQVLFHEHENLTNADAATTEGDTYLEVKDLVGTLASDGSFSFQSDLTERGNNETITIKVKTVDDPDGKRTLEATVDSRVQGGHATDLYVLEKQ